MGFSLCHPNTLSQQYKTPNFQDLISTNPFLPFPLSLTLSYSSPIILATPYLPRFAACLPLSAAVHMEVLAAGQGVKEDFTQVDGLSRFTEVKPLEYVNIVCGMIPVYRIHRSVSIIKSFLNSDVL
jgi:hypothetical protein